MKDDNRDLLELKISLTDSFMETLRSFRLKAACLLAFVIFGYVVREQAFHPDPSTWESRLMWWLCVVAGSFALTLIVGTTVWLWRLERERARSLRDGWGKGGG
ncbi:TPA: hypothetical protein L3E92_004144 [Escherichia coli]|nr:hypothetical protein [Salmonella enterica subsp. enterica serovar Java]HBN5223777.1 hypothetical protein [Escherichia coli]HBV7368483.1 hypothetical protein [Escherichia coli]